MYTSVWLQHVTTLTLITTCRGQIRDRAVYGYPLAVLSSTLLSIPSLSFLQRLHLSSCLHVATGPSTLPFSPPFSLSLPSIIIPPRLLSSCLSPPSVRPLPLRPCWQVDLPTWLTGWMSARLRCRPGHRFQMPSEGSCGAEWFHWDVRFLFLLFILT